MRFAIIGHKPASSWLGTGVATHFFGTKPRWFWIGVNIQGPGPRQLDLGLFLVLSNLRVAQFSPREHDVSVAGHLTIFDDKFLSQKSRRDHFWALKASGFSQMNGGLKMNIAAILADSSYWCENFGGPARSGRFSGEIAPHNFASPRVLWKIADQFGSKIIHVWYH